MILNQYIVSQIWQTEVNFTCTSKLTTLAASRRILKAIFLCVLLGWENYVTDGTIGCAQDATECIKEWVKDKK